MQFAADLTGSELRVATMADCSPLGAVLAGRLGLGFYSCIADLSATPREEIVYRPQLAAERVASLYSGWHSAIRQVLAT